MPWIFDCSLVELDAEIGKDMVSETGIQMGFLYWRSLVAFSSGTLDIDIVGQGENDKFK